MSDVPSIEVTDPLVPAFCLQHDLRERFLHALQEIVALDDESPYDIEKYWRVRDIARQAIDEDEIGKWHDAGRPLPWLDERIGSEVAKLNEAVLDALGRST